MWIYCPVEFQSKTSSELKRFSHSSRRSLLIKVHKDSIRLIVVIPR